MTGVRELCITACENGCLQHILMKRGFSVRICNHLKKHFGWIRINGAPAFVVAQVHSGDVVEITLVDDTPKHIPAYDYPLNVIYEDEDIAVIDKSADLAVISTHAYYGNSLPNALAARWGDFIYRPAGRLDRQTSGLITVAKNMLAHSVMSVRTAETERHYLAIVEGVPQKSGVINAPIAKESDSGIRRCVRDDGKYAITRYETVSDSDNHALLRLRLETGRTHQIRVHCAHIGHPLCGDGLYGGKNDLIGRHALHRNFMRFSHPVTGVEMSFSSPLPADMKILAEQLSLHQPTK